MMMTTMIKILSLKLNYLILLYHHQTSSQTNNNISLSKNNTNKLPSQIRRLINYNNH